MTCALDGENTVTGAAAVSDCRVAGIHVFDGGDDRRGLGVDAQRDKLACTTVVGRALVAHRIDHFGAVGPVGAVATGVREHPSGATRRHGGVAQEIAIGINLDHLTGGQWGADEARQQTACRAVAGGPVAVGTGAAHTTVLGHARERDGLGGCQGVVGDGDLVVGLVGLAAGCGVEVGVLVEVARRIGEDAGRHGEGVDALRVGRWGVLHCPLQAVATADRSHGTDGGAGAADDVCRRERAAGWRFAQREGDGAVFCGLQRIDAADHGAVAVGACKSNGRRGGVQSGTVAWCCIRSCVAKAVGVADGHRLGGPIVRLGKGDIHIATADVIG